VSVEIACGGHPQPLLVRADGSVAEVGGTGLLLGLWPDAGVTSAPVELGPGDSLVLYTDGVTDARAPERLLSSDDLATLLRESAQGGAAEIAQRLELAVTDGDPAEPRDDIALLVVGVEALRAPRAGGGDGVSVELASRPDAPSLARAAVAELSEALLPEALEDLKLLATELVTNSCLHGDGGGPISLELELAAGVARLAVTDDGRGFEASVDAADPFAESGRGLFIVDALADRWGVEGGARTRVWAELDLAPTPTRAP
jgi:anti-sigma regulatory factor (Ser/Thr protein kinase)